MSTRANIKIIKGDYTVWLYHHHDGYPTYLGAFLLWRFLDKLENSMNYLDLCKVVNSLIKDKVDDEFEYTTGMHGDIEYLYELNLDNRTLKCFEASFIEEKDEYGFYKHEIGEELDLKKEASSFIVTRSDKGARDVWYLSNRFNSALYQDDDGNVIYFDNAKEAADMALQLTLEAFERKYEKGE